MAEREKYSLQFSDFNPLDPFRYFDRTRNLDSEILENKEYKILTNRIFVGTYMITAEMTLIVSSIITVMWGLHGLENIFRQ